MFAGVRCALLGLRIPKSGDLFPSSVCRRKDERLPMATDHQEVEENIKQHEVRTDQRIENDLAHLPKLRYQ